ncbi:MAG: M23 family metallopeptidase [Candidatus Falkowbacteria bacterium]
MKKVTLTRKLLNMEELRQLADSPIWDQGETKGLYRFPLPLNQDFEATGKSLAIGIPQDEVYIIGPYYAAKSPESHLSPFKWAIDFLVPDGTGILAAEDGKIIEAVDHFNNWGDSEDFRDQLNYLTIQHSNGEYSQYCHLAPQSFRQQGLKVGDRVKKGDCVARVGKTGWTDRDHLHFIVFKVEPLIGSPFSFYSLKIRFEE